MSVQFLIGRAGTGKTTYMIQQIQKKLKDQPIGTPIIYLVPDQMTFLSEYKLITTNELTGMIRSQVFSFTRLAWRVLQETGGISRTHLNSTGISMLIRKILEENKSKLRLFQKTADMQGFVGHLEQILTEFKRYLVKPEELVTAMNTDDRNSMIEQKLQDLEIIYDQFEKEIKHKYIASEDYLALLAEKIPQSSYVKDAIVFIDGFYSFTPQEYMVIEQLMKHSSEVYISLTLDRPYREDIPHELEMFRMTGDCYATLYEMAKQLKIDILEDMVFQNQHRHTEPSLRHLEMNFHHMPVIPYHQPASITVIEAANRRAEIEGIARKIIAMVREGYYRYKDIAILVRDVHSYQDLFETIFYDYKIPYHIDQKRSMLNHPLIELIRSTLEIITGYWRYEPVFRAVKTDLLFPLDQSIDAMRERMDKLENYCLAYGIQGDKWIKKDRWQYRRIRGLDLYQYAQTDEEREMEQEINELRLMISAPILRLSRRLNKASNGRELCEAIFLYLEELEIPAKLERLRHQAENEGRLQKALEHEQVWNAIIDLLDQFVEMLGNENISVKKFSKIIDSGMESLRFNLVPPAIDQVVIADLELSRLSDIKAAFIIGLNDGVLPRKFSDEGILSDQDREWLRSNGIIIAPTSTEKLLDEEFIAYKAFTTPSEKLFLSFPIANEEGKGLLESPYVKKIKEMFPNGTKLEFHHEPNELSAQEQLEYIANDTVALTYLTSQFQLRKRHQPIAEIWWDVYNYLVEKPNLRKKTEKVLSSLFFENKSKKLNEKITKELYGDTIETSVSRMEMFNSCPYSYFLSHGLKLREREIYRLEAPDIGELFHGALKYIGDILRDNRLTWNQLSKKQCEELAHQAVQHLAPMLQNEILLSSNRYHYMKRKLEKIISRASIVLSEHAKASGFVPIGMEIGFGKKQKLPPIQFQLKNGVKMELMGRIDRVDQAEGSRGVYLRVIDYKSSKKDIHLGEVYYGLALQMLTYLDVLITHSEKFIGKEAIPAGALYFHVHNPIIKSKKILTVEEIEEEIMKMFKMNGLLLSDTEVIKLMDQQLESGQSKIISAGIKKDGQLTATSKVASEDEFKFIRKYIRKVFTEKGNEIMEGKTDIAPYKLNNQTPCKFCSFKSICKFDPTLTENNYRLLPSLNRNSALEFIRKEVEEVEY